MHFLGTISKKLIHKACDFLADKAVRLVDSRADLSNATIVTEPERYTIDLQFIHLYEKRYYWHAFESIVLDPLFYFPVSHCSIVGNGIIMNGEGNVLLESTIFQKEYYEKLKQKHLVLRSKIQKKKFLKGTVISLSTVLENNYYHWITESLGRILILEPYLDLRNAIILLDNTSSSFKAESLFLLYGIPEGNLYLKTTKEAILCDAVVPSFPLTRNRNTAMTDICHPSIIRRLNEKAFRKTSQRSQFPIRFILSRKRADSRRIVNEESLVLAMHPHDFKLIECEALTFKEQVSLFANAEIVITTHGAGLTNIIFCRQTTVIELFPEERDARDAFIFVHISSVLGLQHHLIPYTSCNSHQDLIVDSELAERIKGIISEKEMNRPR